TGLEAPQASVPVAASPRVADLMSTTLQTVGSATSLGDAWGVMKRCRIRHLPVVDDLGRAIGLITHRDLLRAAPSAIGEPDEATRLRRLGWLTAHEIMETHLSVATADELARAAAQRILAAQRGRR